MNSYDWSKFEIFIYIESNPEKLFNKWATASGLESFCMKKVGYESLERKVRDRNEHVKPGDKYIWEFIHGSILQGIIVEVKLNQKISFTFGEQSIVDKLYTDTWSWDGQSWVRISDNGPLRRGIYSLVFNRASNYAMFYGSGIRKDGKWFLDDETWVWKNDDWVKFK